MNLPDAPITPSIAIAPAPVVANATLDNFCLAIRDYEGAPGDRNYRNNNPGNCRYSSVGYAPVYGLVEHDPQNFAIFKDMATGMLYLHNLIKYKVSKSPTDTLLQFMEKYAPVTDGNDPVKYAVFIAQRLNIHTSALMQFIV